jgi:hypothetical protein
MMNGWLSQMVKVALGIIFSGIVVRIWWWLQFPHTPEALYRVCCAACHALPDTCAHPATMRIQTV